MKIWPDPLNRVAQIRIWGPCALWQPTCSVFLTRRVDSNPIRRFRRFLLLVCVTTRYNLASDTILVHGLAVGIVASKELWLSIYLTILISQIKWLGHKLVSIASLASVASNWMGIWCGSLVKWSFIWWSFVWGAYRVCHELSLYNCSLLSLAPLGQRNSSKIARIILSHSILICIELAVQRCLLIIRTSLIAFRPSRMAHSCHLKGVFLDSIIRGIVWLDFPYIWVGCTNIKSLVGSRLF